MDDTPKCAHCARTGILVEMEPGRDGQPWFLCGRCYVDGLKPTYEDKVTVLDGGVSVQPSTGDRTQWTITRTTRSPAKDETANFDRMTEGPAKVRPKKRSSR